MKHGKGGWVVGGGEKEESTYLFAGRAIMLEKGSVSLRKLVGLPYDCFG